MPQQKANSPYLCNIWTYVGEDLHARIWFNIEEYNRSNGYRIYKKGYKLDHHIKAVDGQWALIEFPFELREATSGIRVTAINHDLFRKSFYLDELMVRPAQTNIFRKEAERLWRNNRSYEQPQ